MRYSLIVISFALTLLAAPVPQGQALAIEKRFTRGNGDGKIVNSRDIEKRTVDLGAREPEPLNRGSHRREAVTEPEPLNRGTHDRREPEPLNRGTNDRREPEPLNRGTNDRREPEPLNRGTNDRREPEPLNRGAHDRREPEPLNRGSHRREAKAEPEPLNRGSHRREAEAEAEPEPLNRGSHRREAEAEAMFVGNDDQSSESNVHKRSEEINLRSIYNSAVGIIEALKTRGFSSATLLEPQ